MNFDNTKYCEQRSKVCEKIKKVIEYAVLGNTTLCGHDKCRKVYAEIDFLYRKKDKIDKAEQSARDKKGTEMISIKKYKNLFIQNKTIATIIDLIQEQELKQNARDKQTT